jgi:hypothetical protein
MPISSVFAYRTPLWRGEPLAARVQPGEMVVANKRSRKQFRPNERACHANTTWREVVAVSLIELLLYWLLTMIEDNLARAND